MSSTRGPGAYLQVLARRRAALPFAASVLARLHIAMAPLGLLVLVADTLGDYAWAGAVGGAYAAGIGVGSPLWGRAIDRVGQPRVVAPTAAASGVLLAALALCAAAGGGPAALLALALAAGATAPPVSAAMRLTWRSALPRERWRTAYALDASSVEAIFVLGPLLLVALVQALPPAGPLVVTAVVQAGGALLYTRCDAVRRPGRDVALDSPATPDPLPRTGRLVGPALTAALVVALATAVGFGFIDTSLVATAREVLADESRLGVLFAAIAGGSVVGGLVYGLLPGSATERRRVPVLSAGFAVGLAALAWLLAGEPPPLAALLGALLATGLLIAPGLIVLQQLVDAQSPDGRRAEAQAWLSTAVVAGAAAGTALAGVVVELGGPPASFAAASAALLAAALVALAAQPTWRRQTASASVPDRSGAQI
ncbi:MFS transporter [Pseudokineococcus sp. 1T1Z-3]|uniref:MFS transporter n=1 Tax=Pseudokineococcus sp. 1T1Z-3 TaxID=3132745 RepID=UPI0030AA6123